jgi:hypothetical protein
VGKRLKLHTILAFISVVGGLILFGPEGLIVGPAVLAITTALLEIWSGRNIAALGYVPGDLSGFEKKGGMGNAGPTPTSPDKPPHESKTRNP